jgi:hypothetical protein
MSKEFVDKLKELIPDMEHVVVLPSRFRLSETVEVHSVCPDGNHVHISLGHRDHNNLPDPLDLHVEIKKQREHIRKLRHKNKK